VLALVVLDGTCLQDQAQQEAWCFTSCGTTWYNRNLQPASCKLPAPQGGVDTNALQALQVELLELSDLFPSAVPSWIS